MPFDDLKVFRADVGILWGADAIGTRLGLTRRQAYHLLSAGKLKGAVKIGNRWAITAKALLSNFEPEDGAAHRHFDEHPLGRREQDA